MTPKTSPVCNDISTKSPNTQNNDISEPPHPHPPPQKKNIEIQDFEPPKMVLAYVYIWKYQSTPPPPTHTFLGHQGVKSGRYKNKIKKVTPITIKV